jgi:hypothetical protein
LPTFRSSAARSSPTFATCSRSACQRRLNIPQFPPIEISPLSPVEISPGAERRL